MIASTVVVVGAVLVREPRRGWRSRSSSQSVSGCGTTPGFAAVSRNSQPPVGQSPEPETCTIRVSDVSIAVALKSRGENSQ